MFFFCIITKGNLYAQDNAQCDNILLKAQELPGEDKKIDFLISSFIKNIDMPWSRDLLDVALQKSVALNDQARELNVLFQYNRFYILNNDISMQHYSFGMLRRKSYEYGDYVRYFNSWYRLLEKYIVEGQIEYASYEAKKMADESKMLNYSKGVAYARMIEANAQSILDNTDKSISLYQQALKTKSLSLQERMLIHSKMVTLYLKEADYESAILQTAIVERELERLVEKDPANRIRYNNRFLVNELGYCRIYLQQKDAAMCQKHIERAGEYLSDGNFRTQSIMYYTFRGQYHALKGEYEESDAAFDKALSLSDKSDYVFRLHIGDMKASTLEKRGLYPEAIHLYKQMAAIRDSVNDDRLMRREEAVQTNYKIQNELLENQRNKTYKYVMRIVLAVAFLMLLITLILRSWRIHKKMQTTEQEMRLALAIVQEADQSKERFLKNITFETRTPLNTVVGFVDLLANDSTLTATEIEEYSALINKEANHLMELINRILDVSRMEAGMMSFNLRKCDIVQLCKEAVAIAEMRNKGKVEIVLHSDLSSYMMNMDHQWFVRVLTSLLIVHDVTDESHKVTVTITKTKTDVILKVSGSPLLAKDISKQTLRLQNMTNRLFVSQTNGSYEVINGMRGKVVEITYPVKGD